MLFLVKYTYADIEDEVIECDHYFNDHSGFIHFVNRHKKVEFLTEKRWFRKPVELPYPVTEHETVKIVKEKMILSIEHLKRKKK